MSRSTSAGGPRLRSLAALASVALAAATPAAGQTVAEYTRRADSLVKIWKTATREIVERDSADRSRIPADTVRVGNFVIVTDSARAPLARATAERVSPMLDRAYGTFAARLKTHTFVLRPRPPKSGERPEEAIESGVLDAQGAIRGGSQELPNVESLSTSWLRKSAEVITLELAPPIREWLNTSLPAQPLSARDITADRVDLVLSASQASHDCATGTVARCLQALALTPVADPAFELFNESERRGMIERYANRFRRSDPALYWRCANSHVQAACDSLVRSIPADAAPAATPPGVRRSFVRYALQLGGPAAFDRLASTEGSVSDRIAAAANAPIDSVARGWQRTLMSSSSSNTAMDLATATSAIVWAGVCCALALRSSRWR